MHGCKLHESGNGIWIYEKVRFLKTAKEYSDSWLKFWDETRVANIRELVQDVSR